MRLLPDSNIFIEYWENKRGKADELAAVFEKEEIVICGVVRAELLHGAVSEKHLKSMTAMLDAFDEVDIDDESWQLLGENLYKLRTHGVSVTFADAIIATIAIKNQLIVWTSDKHFRLMQNVLEGLKIRV